MAGRVQDVHAMLVELEVEDGARDRDAALLLELEPVARRVARRFLRTDCTRLAHGTAGRRAHVFAVASRIRPSCGGGKNWFGDTSTLMVHISGLRKKIEDTPGTPHYIQTVRNMGYRFISAKEPVITNH